uniref:SET domain-containing protein n=1 Tax=Trichobilharzia regenti TaxID=157069 RepID=A0AA85KPC8_TRIRE|nr:unnamed protein product [Trichobilharzia regenti]
MEGLRTQRILENLELLEKFTKISSSDAERVKQMYGIGKTKVSASCTRTKSKKRRLTKRKPTNVVVSPHSSKPKRRRRSPLSSDSGSDCLSSGDEWAPKLRGECSRTTGEISGEKEAHSGTPKLMQLTDSEGSRYPKRTKERPNYAADIKIPEDDRYLYCYTCKRSVVDGCFDHPVRWIENLPLAVCKQAEDKYAFHQKTKCVCGQPYYEHAAKTAPGEWVKILRSRIPGAGLGAYANAEIECGTVFGPYGGQVVYLDEMSTSEKDRRSRGGYAWLVRANVDGVKAHLIDARNCLSSNWLRFVNCARFDEEQNLVTVQYRGKIYYRACKDIPKFQELLTYYGKEVIDFSVVNVESSSPVRDI